MTPLFTLFHPYGLIIGIGVLVGVWIVERMSRFFSITEPWLEKALPFMVVGGIVGARLYHLATDWQLYTHASLLDLIAVWRGGIGFLGGIAGGGLGFWLWFTRSSHAKHFFTYLDLLVFGIPVAQAIGRLGNYVNKELYGLPTNLPWAITINGQRYHPLFLYEALANLVLFAVLVVLARKKALVLGKGQFVSLYLFGYAFIRFWLEFLRIETAHLPGPLDILSTAQWVTFVMMAGATVLFWVRRHAPRKQFDFTLE